MKDFTIIVGYLILRIGVFIALVWIAKMVWVRS